jgi:hypothetical protein
MTACSTAKVEITTYSDAACSTGATPTTSNLDKAADISVCTQITASSIWITTDGLLMPVAASTFWSV